MLNNHTTMKRYGFPICAIMVSLLLLSGCDTPEEEVFHDLRALSDRVQTEASTFDADDWEDVMEEFDDIHYDIQYCDFTDEQWKEIGYMEGRLSVVIAKEATKALLDEYSILVKKVSKYSRGYAEGVQDAIHEDITDEDVRGVTSTVRDVYDDVESDWSDFDIDKTESDFERIGKIAEDAWNKND